MRRRRARPGARRRLSDARDPLRPPTLPRTPHAPDSPHPRAPQPRQNRQPPASDLCRRGPNHSSAPCARPATVKADIHQDRRRPRPHRLHEGHANFLLEHSRHYSSRRNLDEDLRADHLINVCLNALAIGAELQYTEKQVCSSASCVPPSTSASSASQADILLKPGPLSPWPERPASRPPPPCLRPRPPRKNSLRPGRYFAADLPVARTRRRLRLSQGPPPASRIQASPRSSPSPTPTPPSARPFSCPAPFLRHEAIGESSPSPPEIRNDKEHHKPPSCTPSASSPSAPGSSSLPAKPPASSPPPAPMKVNATTAPSSPSSTTCHGDRASPPPSNSPPGLCRRRSPSPDAFSPHNNLSASDPPDSAIANSACDSSPQPRRLFTQIHELRQTPNQPSPQFRTHHHRFQLSAHIVLRLQTRPEVDSGSAVTRSNLQACRTGVHHRIPHAFVSPSFADELPESSSHTGQFTAATWRIAAAIRNRVVTFSPLSNCAPPLPPDILPSEALSTHPRSADRTDAAHPSSAPPALPPATTPSPGRAGTTSARRTYRSCTAATIASPAESDQTAVPGYPSHQVVLWCCLAHRRDQRIGTLSS